MKHLLCLLKYGLIAGILILVFFIWKAFIFQHDEVNFNYDLRLTSPNQICHFNDSIILNISIVAKANDRTLRLFNDNSNMQIFVRKAANGDIDSDWGEFKST